jgi:hypothetical protein
MTGLGTEAATGYCRDHFLSHEKIRGNSTMSPRFIPVVAVAALFLAAGARAEIIQLKTSLDGATEVPSVETEGKGTAELTVDTVSKKLTYAVTYAGLSGPATAAHLHGPAAVGVNAGVAVPFVVGPSPMKGEVTLTDAQMADLLGGKYYVNVHTAAHPPGEIRGYVLR